jgi:hypothetical protein
VNGLLFKHKSIVKVHMADLESEKEKLGEFLLNQFKLASKITTAGLELNMDNVPTYSAVIMVTKFIRHKNLSNKYWVSAENNVVKINKFKRQKKTKENKHPVTPSIIKHGF